MKVLIISNYKDSINSVRAEGYLFIELQKMGIDISIMTEIDAPFVSHFKTAGIRLINYHPKKKVSWEAIQFIRAHLIKEKYDILHLFNSKAITNGAFAAIGLPLKVLTYRGVLGITHWWNPNSYLKHLHPRVDGITAASKSIQQYLQKQIFWNKNKIKQFYKGQDLTWYTAIKKADLSTYSIPQNAFIISCIANYRYNKGLHLLIKSTLNLPEKLPIHFLLIGRGIANDKILNLIEKSPYRDQFHILGYRNDALSFIANSNVYIQPSYREGLGKSILEAMSLGIPPIITNVGGPIEYVEHQKSGLVIPTNDPKAIAKAILELYDNPNHCSIMGKAANRVIKNKMNLKNGVLQLKKIYESFCPGCEK